MATLWSRFGHWLIALIAGLVVCGVLYGFLSVLQVLGDVAESFGQDHQEQWAVKGCLRQVRDGDLASTDDCDSYAQANWQFDAGRLAALKGVADKLCLLSLEHLGYAVKEYSGSKNLIAEIRADAESDCGHAAVNSGDVELATLTTSEWARAGLEEIGGSIANLSRQPADAADVACRVADPDLGEAHLGDCVDGLADGYGLARGRDVYVGQFREGEPHGKGVYAWGAESPWPGDVYTGTWRNGTRTGFGTYETPDGRLDRGEFLNGKAHGFVEVRRQKGQELDLEDGRWEGNVWVFRGVFHQGHVIWSCESRHECVKELRELVGVVRAAGSDSQLEAKPKCALIRTACHLECNEGDLACTDKCLWLSCDRPDREEDRV